GGNSLSNSDFLGSTNNMPLIFKVNNNTQMQLSNSGLKLNSLSGSSNSLLQSDANGNVLLFPMGTSNQYLSGTGAWVNLPTIPAPLWSSSGSNIYYNTGKVGIGTNNPQTALDINGDLTVSNNVYVGGGILISNKIHAPIEIKTNALRADSLFPQTLQLAAGRDVLGDASFAGNLTAKNSLTVQGSASVVGNFNIAGNSTIQGVLSTNTLNINTLNLNGSGMGLGYIPASGGSGPVLLFGNQTPPNVQNISCNNSTPNNNSGLHNFFGDVIQIYNYWGASTPGKRVLSIGTDYSGASIDLAGQADNTNNTNGSLLIDYYCGKDVFICNNLLNGGGSNGRGGVVSMGQNVTIGNPFPSDYSAALVLKSQTGINNAIKIQDANNNPVFSVESNGKTHIGGSTQLVSGPHGNAALTVAGKAVFQSAYVTMQNWSDFVFDKNYSLMPLQEVERFYKKEHHLPNVPTTKEIQEKGNNLGETDAILLRKIEELTLYLVEQKNIIEKLQEDNKELKRLIKK
ncbi:MAG: hypothetical protein JST67_04155, partial [Bacteroidetes bacterium]|nr:hypothetical protein [Bacteroidota bacterium]